jgi:hypothetical protein
VRGELAPKGQAAVTESSEDSRVSAQPEGSDEAFVYGANNTGRLTHYLFRFPAKFHPPVARALLAEYADDQGPVLDPFCGSGTLLVEAAVAGIPSIGLDVDPLSTFVSRVKTQPLDVNRLTVIADVLEDSLRRHRRPTGEYIERQFEDISDEELARAAVDLPAIPNISHWFRRYVMVDLAHIRDVIGATDMSPRERAFFRLCFASIIRGASNADPVPVSGLEVTAYMKRKDLDGRVVNPFALFAKAVAKAVSAMAEYSAVVQTPPTVKVRTVDSRNLRTVVRHPVSAVITSPPYHGAVDYYRRHQLEMFWLDLTTTQADRLALLDGYIGRPRVPRRDKLLRASKATLPGAQAVKGVLRQLNGARADAFKHYCLSMTRVFSQVAGVLPVDAPALFIVGHSSWNGAGISTPTLFAELAGPDFVLDRVLAYEVTNRYMSYARHNGASIDKEYVVVLRRAGIRNP